MNSLWLEVDKPKDLDQMFMLDNSMNLNKSLMVLEECTNLMVVFIWVISIMEEPKEKEPSFLKMDLTTKVTSTTIMPSQMMENTNLVNSFIMEDLETIHLMDKP